MTVNIIAARSPSGAFMRSPSGAFTRAGRKYYFIDETQYVDINFSDFSWSSTAHTTGSYVTTEDVVSYDLYDYDTGDSLGQITDTIATTPKVAILYYAYSGGFGTYDLGYIRLNISTAPPNNFIDVSLRNSISPTSTAAPMAYGQASTIAETFFSRPTGMAGGTLKRDGNYFYPVRFRIPVDVDVDTWFYGKYSDTTSTTATYYLTDKNFTQTSITISSNTFTYYDSFAQTTYIYVRG